WLRGLIALLRCSELTEQRWERELAGGELLQQRQARRLHLGVADEVQPIDLERRDALDHVALAIEPPHPDPHQQELSVAPEQEHVVGQISDVIVAPAALR